MRGNRSRSQTHTSTIHETGEKLKAGEVIVSNSIKCELWYAVVTNAGHAPKIFSRFNNEQILTFSVVSYKLRGDWQKTRKKTAEKDSTSRYILCSVIYYHSYANATDKYIWNPCIVGKYAYSMKTVLQLHSLTKSSAATERLCNTVVWKFS